MLGLETRVTAVVVYPDRARVTRLGSTTFENGLHQIELSGLPVRMNPESARVSARGTARARLLGLQVQRAFYAETPTEQVRALEAQLEAAQDEMSALEAQIALVIESRKRLDSLAGHTDLYARALAAGETTVEAQLAYFDAIRRSAARLDDEGLSLQASKRVLERRIQQLQQQLEQLRNARPRERFTAQVEIEVFQPGDLTIELSYVISGAGWSPLYDLRLEEDGEKPALEIGYLAQVSQQSGEDWQDVALTLSTARPALASRLPELDPWYIEPVRALPLEAAPAPRKAGMRSVAAAAPMVMGMDAARAAPAEEALATVQQSGAAVNYLAPGRVTIPPDGAKHKVIIARYPLVPNLDYVAAPPIVQAVYRRAKVVNTSPYTLLPGMANLFAGDDFIGVTGLELVAPQGEIELYLGVDDRIKVERELKRREVDKTLIGGKRRLHYGYEIRLENLLGAAASLTLQDQIPVARHEEIKVRLDSVDPKPAEQSALNLLNWELTLAPNEKRFIRFEFTVEYPHTLDVQGLP
jgi:uncharacterized protein (TIGR02231 family)